MVINEKGERSERCRWQIQRGERVAGVGGQRSRADGKATTGHPNRAVRLSGSRRCEVC